MARKDFRAYKMILIEHPDVPGQVEVPEISLPHHVRAGWRRVDAKPKSVRQDVAKPNNQPPSEPAK